MLNKTDSDDNRHTLMPLRSLLILQLLIVFVAAAGISLSGVELATQGLADAAAVGLGVVAGMTSFLLICGLSHMGSPCRNALRHQSQFLVRFAAGYPIPGLLAMSILAGIGEELLFRGLVQGSLAALLGSSLAVIIASLVFGLAHCMSRAYFVMATVMGLCLGIGYVLSASLLMVMVWHATYDLIALVVLARFPGLLGVGTRGVTGNGRE